MGVKAKENGTKRSQARNEKPPLQVNLISGDFISGDFSLLTNLNSAIKHCSSILNKPKFELVSQVPKVFVKPYFNNRASKNTVSLLIDTGASFSCITQSLFDKLRNSIGIFHEKQQRPTATVAKGKPLLSCGETVFDLVFNKRSSNAKISNIRFSIFPSLSSDLILGWEVIKHLNLHIKEQGKTLGLDQINIPIGQEESSLRGAIDLVTTHPKEATLIKSKNSGPFIWTPMTCSYSHCNGSTVTS